MDYLKQFNELKQRLNDAGANITYESTEPIVTEGEVPYLEEEYGFKLRDDVFQFYNNLNGAELDWNIQYKNQQINGFMNMPSLIDILDTDTEGKLWVDWYNKDDIEEVQQHKIFEYITGTDYYITIRFDENGNYKLFYIAEGAVNHGGSKRLPEIPLNIEQYFKVITTYYGFSNIRYHLHKDEFYSKPFDVLPELKVLEEIFPGFKPPAI